MRPPTKIANGTQWPTIALLALATMLFIGELGFWVALAYVAPPALTYTARGWIERSPGLLLRVDMQLPLERYGSTTRVETINTRFVGWPFPAIELTNSFDRGSPLPPGRVRMHPWWMSRRFIALPSRVVLLPGAIIVWLKWALVLWCVSTIRAYVQNRARRKDPGTCPCCGYNVAGIPRLRCPECGRSPTDTERRCRPSD